MIRPHYLLRHFHRGQINWHLPCCQILVRGLHVQRTKAAFHPHRSLQIRFLLRLTLKNPTPHLLNLENRKQTPFLKSNGRKNAFKLLLTNCSNRFDRRVNHYCFCKQLFYPPIGLYFSTRPHLLMGVFWTH